MTDDFLIAPSILSADFSQLAQQLALAEQAGADWIHIDVMDGHFVPNITVGPFIVEACRRSTSLPLDVHLMIASPERYLADFASAGADIITIHAEASSHSHRLLQQIRRLGCRSGLALNPGTQSSVLQPLVAELDLALVMTVNPGFSGQAFIPAVLPKISAVREILAQAGSNALIEVDGGIDPATLTKAHQAGARVFVAGSSVFASEHGIAAGVAALKAALGK